MPKLTLEFLRKDSEWRTGGVTVVVTQTDLLPDPQISNSIVASENNGPIPANYLDFYFPFSF